MKNAKRAFFIFFCCVGIVVFGMEPEQNNFQNQQPNDNVEIQIIQDEHFQNQVNKKTTILQKIGSIANKLSVLCKKVAQRGKNTTKYYLVYLIEKYISNKEEQQEIKQNIQEVSHLLNSIDNVKEEEEFAQLEKALAVNNKKCCLSKNYCCATCIKSICYRGYSTLITFFIFYLFYGDTEKALEIAFIDFLIKTFVTYIAWEFFWQRLKNCTSESKSSHGQTIHKLLTYGEVYSNTEQFNKMNENLDKLSKTLSNEIEELQYELLVKNQQYIQQ
jgi:uncharacterized membrane protein